MPAEFDHAMQNNTLTLPRVLFLICFALLLSGDRTGADDRPWCHIFSVNKAELTDVGKSRYFLLWPGYRMLLQHGKDTLTISVLDETKIVDGVKTRVVEERETKDGKIVSHEGAWLAGVNGAKFGLMMPGRPEVGDKYYQESAPRVAMDRAEVISCNEECTTPEKTFEKCVRIRETSALESGSSDKLYAPGVGLIKDGEFLLTALNCPVCNGKNPVPTFPAR
jgi:hypothetical protein